MLNFAKSGFFKLPLFFLIFLGLLFTWLGFGERGFIHLFRVGQDRQAYSERIRKLERDNQELWEEIERLRSDEKYIESVARRELGLLKTDEILYRFSREKD